MPKHKITVAEYVGQQLAISGKTQREVALAAGYDRPNFITMIKQGQSKLPINRAPALAKALGVDPSHFLRIVLQEYMPEVWAAVEEIMKSSDKVMLTQDEHAVIELVRAESGNVPLDVTDEKNREILVAAVHAIAKREYTEREAVRKVVEALPRHSNLRKNAAA